MIPPLLYDKASWLSCPQSETLWEKAKTCFSLSLLSLFLMCTKYALLYRLRRGKSKVARQKPKTSTFLACFFPIYYYFHKFFAIFFQLWFRRKKKANWHLWAKASPERERERSFSSLVPPPGVTHRSAIRSRRKSFFFFLQDLFF